MDTVAAPAPQAPPPDQAGDATPVIEFKGVVKSFEITQSHFASLYGNERVNQELLRRSRVVRIFPNPTSCLRLASASFREWHEDWISGRRYLRMEALVSSKPHAPERLAA